MKSYLERFLGRGLVVAVSFAMYGCTAHEKPSAVETVLANAAKDVVIPIEAERSQNPFHDDEKVVSQGKEIYMQSCAICHGSDGHGKTILGQGMYPPAMDMTSPHVQHWKDPEMFWIIQNGVRLTGMPSWKEAISEQDTWKLVTFIRQLPKLETAQTKMDEGSRPSQTEEQKIAYGKTLYRQEGCFICHRLDGEGGKVGPDLTEEANRGRSPDWLIGHFRDPKAYVPGSIMPSFKNLTNEQLSGLTAFLLSQKK